MPGIPTALNMSCLTHSHFGGFLIHRGWFRLARKRKARAVLSTGCNAVSPRQYVHCADDIGVVLVAAIHTLKPGLCLPVFFGDMPATRAGLAGVMRRHGNERRAVPVEFVLKLAAKLKPALIEDGFVQPRLGRYIFPGASVVPLLDLDILPTCKSSIATTRKFLLISVVALCRKSLRALPIRVWMFCTFLLALCQFLLNFTLRLILRW